MGNADHYLLANVGHGKMAQGLPFLKAIGEPRSRWNLSPQIRTVWGPCSRSFLVTQVMR